MSTQNVASEAGKKAILKRLEWSDSTVTEMLPAVSFNRSYTNKCLQVLHEEKKIHISEWVAVFAKDGKNMWVARWGYGESKDAVRPTAKYPARRKEKVAVGETRIKPEEGRWRMKEIEPGIRQYSPTNKIIIIHEIIK